jgi:Na+-transporting NADH:ubiquinone oxidoreductase subunit B
MRSAASGQQPVAATLAAPHVRAPGDLRTLSRAFLVALAPCLAFGLYNTGLQANLARAALGIEETPGWRGQLLERTGAGFDPTSPLACALHGALYLLPLLFVCLAVGGIWERVFARARGRELQPGLTLLALLFTLALPPTLPLWQAALGFSFGVVVGREIFGGAGRYVVHPALAGLAFLYLSYPAQLKGDAVWVPVEGHAAVGGLSAAAAGGAEALGEVGITWTRAFLGVVPGALGETSALACLAGAAVLVLARAISWRILVGAVLGVAVAAQLLAWSANPALPAADLPWRWHVVVGSFAFAVVFLATDPVVAPMTQSGRWIYGTAIGALVVLIRVASPIHPEGTTLAILLANVFAPLIDHGVVRAHSWRRRRRRRPGCSTPGGGAA